MNKPIRYIVNHVHQYRPDAPIERARVSYSAYLDKGLSYATQTAARYHGELVAEYANGNVATIADYRRRQDRDAEARLSALDGNGHE